MALIQTRQDDVVIQRRIRVQDATHPITQVYVVLCPGHDDHGTEHRQYDDALRVALAVAEGRGLSVWYEEHPQSGRRTLIMTFRT